MLLSAERSRNRPSPGAARKGAFNHSRYPAALGDGAAPFPYTSAAAEAAAAARPFRHDSCVMETS